MPNPRIEQPFAVGLYSLLLLFSGVWMVSSLVGNWQKGFEFSPSDIAFTFVAMTVYAISALMLQINRTPSPWLFVQTVVVGVPLIIAMIYHLFPGKSMVAASVHLTAATIFTAVNIVIYLRVRT